MPTHGSYHHESCGLVKNQGNLEIIMPGGHETGVRGELSRVIAFTWSTQTWRQLPSGNDTNNAKLKLSNCDRGHT